MDTDIHALIRGFLQQRSIVPLKGDVTLPEGGYTKAGVVPFYRRDGGLRYYVMKPRGNIPALGEPLFQVCKGTRQHRLETVGWRDMKESAPVARPLDRETLAETALREGIEELGLKLPNTGRLFDLGGFTFSSATTGKEKHMWLFAAEVEAADDFLPNADIAATTETCEWLTVGEFAVAGRADHRYIVAEIERRLKAHFQE